MATFKLYLDTRYNTRDGLCPLRLMVNHKGRSAAITLGVRLSADQWDSSRQRVVNKSDRAQLNSLLAQVLAKYQRNLMELTLRKRIATLSAISLRDALQRMVGTDCGGGNEGSFKQVYDDFVKAHENPRTRGIYAATWVKIERYDPQSASLGIDEVNREWLQSFFTWMARESPSVNARNIHLRNIRAVFNFAIDNEITDSYPFRRIKITPVETAKRNLTLEQLRLVFNYDMGESQKYVDLFKLSFLLIGINTVDILTVPKEALRNGRLEFNRRKTNTFYSIKVEPEAMEIIGKYEGKEHLLRFCDNGYNYRNFAMMCNRKLNGIMPRLSTYWARHSWASIASELDIPEDVISRALGHTTSGAAVTRTYINFNHKKVDDANRRVIDCVLYGGK